MDKQQHPESPSPNRPASSAGDTGRAAHGSGERKGKFGESDMKSPAMDEPVYVISVAAKLVGMPAWTLRVLDEQGIVSPKRTDKNRRLYSDLDLIRLARVRELTEVEGVNMNGVRMILKLEEQRAFAKGE